MRTTTLTPMLRAPGFATGATLALLVAALFSGALRSPLLLLLPFALLHAQTVLPRAHARTLLLFAGAVLLLGEVVREALAWVEITAVVAVVGLVFLRARGSAAATEGQAKPLQLPARPHADVVRDALGELERQVGHVRGWSAAAAVTLWEVHGGRARPLVAVGRQPPADVRREGDPLLWVAREGTPAWLEPTPHWSEPGRSVAAARVWSDADVAWLVTWEYEDGGALPTHEALAAWCGPLRVLLDVLSAQSRAVAGQEQLERLLAMLRRIPVEIELERFADELLHAAMQLTGATGAVLGTWLDEQGRVVAVAGHDGGPAPGAYFEGRRSELGLAIAADTTLVREAGQWTPAVNPLATKDDEWLARPRALVTLPLSTPARTVGALALWSTRTSRFDASTIELLGAVMPYAALHLEHAREYGRLQETADRDPLTGLRNRRGFESAFAREVKLFERYGHPLSLLMIDIDHFKSINDQYGHPAGDDVLRTLAATIEHTVRDVDVPARFGGEEFIVLLPETPLRAAAEAAERLRSAVERATFRAGGRELPVRVSVGVSSCPERVREPGGLVASADAALYEAKRGGRNRVVEAVAGVPTM